MSVSFLFGEPECIVIALAIRFLLFGIIVASVKIWFCYSVKYSHTIGSYNLKQNI